MVTTEFVTLDDDPTGTQAMANVPLVLDWSGAALRTALAHGAPAVHVLTNTRARRPAEAYAQTRAACLAARAAAPRAHLLLRGDSTLRAHFREEAQALAEVAYPGRATIVVLAPALPAAGRITSGGLHYVERAAVRYPVASTEFARDGIFAYRSSRLLEWAEERSAGLYKASDGAEVHLEELRAHGAVHLERRLHALSERGTPCVLSVDAETDADVALAAEGLRLGLRAGLPLVIRSSPAFAAAIEGTMATAFEPPPATGAGVLVVCGSYVEQSTRQLEALTRAFPECLLTVDVAQLAGDSPTGEVERIAQAAGALLKSVRIAVVATPRQRPDELQNLESGARVANGLAAIVARVRPRPGVVVSKGGITSAVVARRGLAAELAHVIGPIATGVALWRCDTEALVVVPGNVGDDSLLRDIVQLLQSSR